MSKELSNEEIELDLDDTVEELTQEQIIELELNEICVDSEDNESKTKEP